MIRWRCVTNNIKMIVCRRVFPSHTTTTATRNFTKCRAFRDRDRNGSFLGGEETESRADRKFKRDLRQSLARKSIVITGTDRPARLISRFTTVPPREIDPGGLPNWKTRIDLALRNAAFKSAAEKMTSRCEQKLP